MISHIQHYKQNKIMILALSMTQFSLDIYVKRTTVMDLMDRMPRTAFKVQFQLEQNHAAFCFQMCQIMLNVEKPYHPGFWDD